MALLRITSKTSGSRRCRHASSESLKRSAAAMDGLVLRRTMPAEMKPEMPRSNLRLVVIFHLLRTNYVELYHHFM